AKVSKEDHIHAPCIRRHRSCHTALRLSILSQLKLNHLAYRRKVTADCHPSHVIVNRLRLIFAQPNCYSLWKVFKMGRSKPGLALPGGAILNSHTDPPEHFSTPFIPVRSAKRCAKVSSRTVVPAQAGTQANTL